MGAPSSRGSSFYFLSSHPPPNLPPPQKRNKTKNRPSRAGWTGRNQVVTQLIPTHCPPAGHAAVWSRQDWPSAVGATRFRSSRELGQSTVTGAACPRPGTGVFCLTKLGLVICRANSGNHPEIQDARSSHQHQVALGPLVSPHPALLPFWE